jgi:hypothetical protein
MGPIFDSLQSSLFSLLYVLKNILINFETVSVNKF